MTYATDVITVRCFGGCLWHKSQIGVFWSFRMARPRIRRVAKVFSFCFAPLSQRSKILFTTFKQNTKPNTYNSDKPSTNLETILR